ncbi:MAG: ADP-ribose pyrophosphatase [Sedimenticola sp.]|jgi:ADP-ribose pyrophosphatase|nr:MAG: ADP-ribose pyrophosphatase [Sedimenticola sp.]
MKYLFEILKTETAYQGFLQLNRYQLRHDLFAGGVSPVIGRERIEGYNAASVLLYDPNLDQVVMIEQFRIGAMADPRRAWLLEIVGGLIEGDESAEAVAQREALEEAGCEIQDLIPICDFWVSPGYTTERIFLFCGRVDASNAGGIHGLDNEGEDIRVEVMQATDVISELYGGRVNSTSAIVAVQWLAMNRDKLRKKWLGG